MRTRVCHVLLAGLASALLATCAMAEDGSAPPGYTDTPQSATVQPSPFIASAPSTEIGPTVELAPGPPRVERRCPAHAEVSFSDLGASPLERLVVFRDTAPPDTPWSLVEPDGGVRGVFWADATVRTAWMSPTGEYLAFLRTSPAEGTSTVWVSSIDASAMWSVPISDPRGFGLRWVTSDSLLLFEAEGPYPVTCAIIYPFEQRVVQVPEVYLDFGLYAISPDGEEMIYLSGARGDRSLQMVDFGGGSETPVLTWFDADSVQLPFYAELHWFTESLVLAYMDAEILEVAYVPSASLTGGTASVSAFRLTDGATAWGFNSWSDGALLPFYRVQGSYELDQTGPTYTYLLDLGANAVIDYCLEEQGLLPGVIRATSDGSLLAWTQTRSGNTGTIVLDPMSGAWSWLPGIELVGWGRLQPQ
jgi:hypothetical protein